ncbi:hypothetical protein GP2_045_00120 [Gordonia paraffinivorans NBRC 108238]|uniref:Uncharacterized protein n=1 Tax=Gordonia paraffinivorans NBRC 108238 TaxID=1223543 RepID=A0ABQ0IQQ6_9ACTN|nr:hypothetical protein GP2_045_00120 [Gordonia paraffinivorans NBRC 108238]
MTPVAATCIAIMDGDAGATPWWSIAGRSSSADRQRCARTWPAARSPSVAAGPGLRRTAVPTVAPSAAHAAIISTRESESGRTPSAIPCAATAVHADSAPTAHPRIRCTVCRAEVTAASYRVVACGGSAVPVVIRRRAGSARGVVSAG